jgi:hypothetical protein
MFLAQHIFFLPAIFYTTVDAKNAKKIKHRGNSSISAPTMMKNGPISIEEIPA